MNPAIERLKEMPREMTAEQAAHVLDRSRDFVVKAINRDKMEARGDSGRGTGDNRRYLITREALLVFIVRSTTGDRLTLLDAIDMHLDKALRDLARRVAAGALDAATTEAQKPEGASAKPKLRNVVPFEHPDLFDPVNKAAS